MVQSEEDLRRRLATAQESLDTELKPWIDPASDHGRAIIAKACMSLRNVNGGFLILGIADDGSCIDENAPTDVRERYNTDSIQEIVSKYSSEAFEIRVHYVEREGRLRVIVEVPGGVRTPVFCRNGLPKKDLPTIRAGSLLRCNDTYVRTLESNGRVSSAPAVASDWARMMEFCFNNREADIGAFVRRQLSGLDAATLIDALQHVIETVRAPAPKDRLVSFMNKMDERFRERLGQHEARLQELGTREFAAIVLGDPPRPTLTRDYMAKFFSIPRYSGWPPWVEMMNIYSAGSRVSWIEDGVEAFDYLTSLYPSLDFSRIDESGQYFYTEALRDDMTSHVSAKTSLEFAIETARVAEIVATCLAFSKEMYGRDCPYEIAIAFRWRGLKGRRLAAWAHPARSLSALDRAVQNEVVSFATMPVVTAPDAIGTYVEAIVRPVFRLFGGWEFDSSVIQDLVQGRLSRRLDT